MKKDDFIRQAVVSDGGIPVVNRIEGSLSENYVPFETSVAAESRHNRRDFIGGERIVVNDDDTNRLWNSCHLALHKTLKYPPEAFISTVSWYDNKNEKAPWVYKM